LEFLLDKKVVLFADHNRDLQQAVGLTLEGAGYNVVFADNGLQALELWRTNPIDAIISDVVMPSMSGFQLCKSIRHSSKVPFILLIGQGNEDDIVSGFEVGADDYVAKPFRPRELVIRLQALLRRSNGRSPYSYSKIACGQFTLDLESHRVNYRGKNIPVSPLEFQLLKYLMQNAGVVLSKEDLLRNVWGCMSSGADKNMIEATVRRLRKKVESDPSQPRFIQTVWGSGYRFGD
jgi:two-component system response regulator MtrA